MRYFDKTLFEFEAQVSAAGHGQACGLAGLSGAAVLGKVAQQGSHLRKISAVDQVAASRLHAGLGYL